MFEFQNLAVYKKAKLFHLESKQLLRLIQLEKTERDQLYRASFSIILNIAEGSGRSSNKDRRNFFVVSRASVFECASIFDVLHDSNEINKDTFDSFLKKADQGSFMQ